MNTESNGIQVIRPIALSDLDALEEFALAAHHGLYSLPKDRQLLKKKILDSKQSFSKDVAKPEGEIYLFVLEDIPSAKVIGTCCIVSKVGTTIPFYAFQIDTVHQSSTSVNIQREHKILKLATVRRGPTEIGGLFLLPHYRKGGLGRLLSFSRFLFMASHPHRFHDVIVAEMRGVVKDNGYSPFWEHLGRHFFQMDFPTATLLRSIEEEFIGDLAPQYPIYVEFLPLEAQEVIGRTHESTLPALHLLQKEGFSYYNEVDIFDAGPDLYASFKDLRTINDSKVAAVAEITSEIFESPPYIIGTTNIDFRCCIAHLLVGNNGNITINASTAEGLEANKGDLLRFVPLHSPLKR